MTGKEVIKKLQAAGFVLKSVKGSHHKMVKGNISIPVPVHSKKDLGKGLLKEIEKQTGVKL